MGRMTRATIGAATVVAMAGCGDAAALSSPAPGTATTPGAGAGGATVASASLSGHGTVLVTGSGGMTLYQFAKDTPGSGTSACAGGCSTTWPALTVPAGGPPNAPGLPGQWATIARPDGARQVTYNGLPLYRFSGDTKTGDANGNYPGWSVVPVSGSASGTPASGAAPATPTPTSPY